MASDRYSWRYARRGVPSILDSLECAMSLDWSQCAAVESVPGKVSGAWLFRGTRRPVAAVFENLEAGLTVSEVAEQFDVTPAQIHAVLEFVAHSAAAPVHV